MKKEIIVEVGLIETRVAILEDGKLVEIHVERKQERKIVGNIYKGKTENVLPGMQAAFIDIGEEKNSFLYVDDLISDEDLPIEKKLFTGEKLLVEVIKEPIKPKGSRVTTNITIPGRYLVLMPKSKNIGISRKIEDEEERERLKKIVQEIKPPDMGVIIRTASEGKEKEDLERDLKFLISTWETILKKSAILPAPSLLYEDLSLIYRTIRDLFTTDVERFIIDSEEEYKKILEFLEGFAPHLKDRVYLFRELDNIFEYFGIEDEIRKALRKRVWLKCGGYIFIDQTEALTVIDVNTGKYVGKSKLSETILRTNLEAAEEIARQLRLRDIGGIIIIDFIDMEDKEDEQKVIEKLEEALSKDKTKTNIVDITKLGLLEMTRKRVRRDLGQMLMVNCSHCDGTGRAFSETTVHAMVLRKLHSLAKVVKDEFIFAEVNSQTKKTLLEKREKELEFLKEKYNKKIVLMENPNLPREKVRILFTGNEEEAKKEGYF